MFEIGLVPVPSVVSDNGEHIPRQRYDGELPRTLIHPLQAPRADLHVALLIAPRQHPHVSCGRLGSRLDEDGLTIIACLT